MMHLQFRKVLFLRKIDRTKVFLALLNAKKVQLNLLNKLMVVLNTLSDGVLNLAHHLFKRQHHFERACTDLKNGV